MGRCSEMEVVGTDMVWSGKVLGTWLVGMWDGVEIEGMGMRRWPVWT